MPSAAPNGVFTTRPPSTPPGNRSWPAGPFSGSASSRGHPTAGPPRSTSSASHRAPTPRRAPSARSVAWSRCPQWPGPAVRLRRRLRPNRPRVRTASTTPTSSSLPASATTGSSTPIRPLALIAPGGPAGGPHATASASSVRKEELAEALASLVAQDPRYGTVKVTAWHGLHPRLVGRGRWAGQQAPPIVKGSVIHVEVEHLPKPTARTKRTLWLFWSGTGVPDLDLCWRSYLRRFDVEHTFRFAKNTLGWTTPSLPHPRAGQRWSGWWPPH